MRRIGGLCYLTLLFASYACADQGTDRTSIGRTIVTLGDPVQRRGLMSEQGWADFEHLHLVNPSFFRFAPASTEEGLDATDRPTVTISREPWGEATISYPNVLVNTVPSIRFITADVAVVEAFYISDNDAAHQETSRLFFVLKKTGDTWKVESVRALGPEKPYSWN